MSEKLILTSPDELKQFISDSIKESLSEISGSHSNESSQSPLMTRQEVASILDVSLVTLNQWVKDGRIPKPRKIGKRVLFLRKEFMDFIESKDSD